MKKRPVNTMDATRFRELAATYGSRLERWPAEERGAAERLVAESSEAGAWLTSERGLDDLLESAPAAAPSAALLRRVAEIPLRHEVKQGFAAFFPMVRLRSLVAAVTAAAALGIALGMAVPDSSDTETGWEDLSALASASDVVEDLSP